MHAIDRAECVLAVAVQLADMASQAPDNQGIADALEMVRENYRQCLAEAGDIGRMFWKWQLQEAMLNRLPPGRSHWRTYPDALPV